MEYQYSGMVSDESIQSIGHQFGPQTLVYGSITQIGREYRLVVRATDVEKAVTSIRSVTVNADRRLEALLEGKADGRAGESMANALYSGLNNPWRFTVQTDKPGGDYHDSEEMILVGAYEKPFVVQQNLTGPLSNNLLVRGITVESKDTRTDIRPVATSKFTYSIGP
jgi:hypothetical protein